jgi:hypothetical protein
VLVELYESRPEEPALRADILGEMWARFDVERQAVSAAFSAFVRGLREERIGSPTGGSAVGDGKGIRLKAEGEVLEE